jgi:hypothetical protein
MPEGQSMSAMQPHADTAGSSDGTHFGPHGLAAQSAGAVQPQIICDAPCAQCGPRGLAEHSPSAEHWHEAFVQCGPNVLFAQSVSARHDVQECSGVHAERSGSVHCELLKHIAQVPVAGSQCFFAGLVQSPSVPQPHAWSCGTHVGPFALLTQSFPSSQPHVCDARHFAPSVLPMQSTFVVHPQKFPA